METSGTTAKPHEHGMKRLIEEFRSRFRIGENLNNYSQEDYRNAERKYVKHALLGRIS